MPDPVLRISSKSPQQLAGVFELAHYLASRTSLSAGHVASMPKSHLPKKAMLQWVRASRVTGGQEMTHSRSLERYLKRLGLSLACTVRHASRRAAPTGASA